MLLLLPACLARRRFRHKGTFPQTVLQAARRTHRGRRGLPWHYLPGTRGSAPSPSYCAPLRSVVQLVASRLLPSHASRAVAEAFASQGYFFSSTGGSPLSCALGMTVLDVLGDEALQDNARHVGGHLKTRLEALGDRHPIIGTVHGFGLYLGVEMIRDAATLEPATRETRAVCDRMLELGVIIQPTGDHSNILKTKPPLCIDVEAADFYVDTLDRALSELQFGVSG